MRDGWLTCRKSSPKGEGMGACCAVRAWAESKGVSARPLKGLGASALGVAGPDRLPERMLGRAIGVWVPAHTGMSTQAAACLCLLLAA